MALKQDSVHFILYPKRGLNKIEGVVLNRGCIYFKGYFCPKQSQGFKPSNARSVTRPVPGLSVFYS